MNNRNNTRNESVISAKKAVKSLRKHGLAGIPVRYLVVIMSGVINALSYSMRTNVNLTIVAMVKRPNTTHLYNTCPNLMANTTHPEDEVEGDFEWTESMQGVILGAYYYGYIVTNIFGGQLADYFGSRWLCAASILSSSLLTLIVPICSFWNIYSLIAVRVLTGLVQGVLTPSLYTLFAHWVPIQERSLSVAVIVVGGNIGAVLTNPLSAYLSQYGFAGGWPSVFYVLGIGGCLCFIPWIYVVYSTPSEHPRIRGKELFYIQANVTASSKRKRKVYVPWGSILTSKQVWVLLISKFCNSWGNLFLMSKLPVYLESILHMSLNMNGIINAGVYIAFSASLLFFGYIADVVEKKRLLNRTVSRKVFETLALVGAAILMAVIPLVGCDQNIVILLLILGMILLGLISGGDSLLVMDIAPDYAGTLYGFQNSFASLPGFIAPLVVGLFLDNNDSTDPMKQWNILFYIASGIYLFGGIVFVVFASAKPEPWGRARTGTVRTTIDENGINGSIYLKSNHGTICETNSINDSNESHK